MNNIGLIDADLLDGGTRHPNIALMKISAYWKNKGYQTKLITDWDDLVGYFHLFLSKVFTKTKTPLSLCKVSNITSGGTGFLGGSPNLPDEIEHMHPDYELYDQYIWDKIKKGQSRSWFAAYMDYSIGFLTRGCFRKCEFCVNKKYDHVDRHANLVEFLNKDRPYIYLWDDNILGYIHWKAVFKELEESDKPFQFKQGLDIRCLTEEKAEILAGSKWRGDFIFAFDQWKDRELIESKLALWRKYCISRNTKLYLLCAYPKPSVEDIISIFKRIEILIQFKCLPYIMRYDTYKNNELTGMYINLARWCNQPAIFKKMSFREFCYRHPKEKSTMRYYLKFIKKYPKVEDQYFNIKFL